jgi:lysophospholipase L1-like esterase
MKTLYNSLKLIAMVFIMTETILAQDWANLNRFKDENKNVDLPSPYENRIVFMGNSITQGWIEQRPQFFADKPIINRGISGQTTPQMLIRFRQDVVDLKPKVVVILAGTNDIAGNTGPSTLEMILDNLKSMTEIAKANKIKVILSSVLPAFDYPWRPGLIPNEKIPTLNKMIKEYTNQNDVIYLDYFSSLADERNGLPLKYSDDGVHPNAEGYKVMEPLVEEAIEEAFKKN